MLHHYRSVSEAECSSARCENGACTEAPGSFAGPIPLPAIGKQPPAGFSLTKSQNSTSGICVSDDPEAPPVRPERHIQNLIATMRRRLIVLPSRYLCCRS